MKKITPQDSLFLGKAQEQSGSELQAGFRAELDPSPLTRALSTMRGRMIAKTMSFMVSATGARNFIAARIPLLMQAMIENLPAHTEKPLIVSTAAGYSPLGIWLAEELPYADIVEIDLPEVISKRQMRFKKAGITLPKNLTSIAADLGMVPLLDVLEGRHPQIIEWTGAYSPHDEAIHIMRYFHSILADDGVCVGYFPWQGGIDAVRAGTRFFKDQIGDMPGVVATRDELTNRFTAAGYAQVDVLMPVQYAPHIGITGDLINIEVLAVGHK